MTRTLLLLLATTLVAASAALASATKLTVISRGPLAARGTSFHPGEHVLVVAITDAGRASKRLQAGAGGGFVARFTSIHLTLCSAYTVRATGDQGSRAVVRVMPECPQPIAP